MNRDRQKLREIESLVVLIWVPLHFGIKGNERADVLADEGTEISKENVPVSEAISKAGIKARKWQPEYQK